MTLIKNVKSTLENFTISDGSLGSFDFFDFFLYESPLNINIRLCVNSTWSFNPTMHSIWARNAEWHNQPTRFFSGPLWNISWQTPPCCTGRPAGFSHRCPYQRCLCRPLYTHWQETPPRGDTQIHNNTRDDTWWHIKWKLQTMFCTGRLPQWCGPVRGLRQQSPQPQPRRQRRPRDPACSWALLSYPQEC